MGHGEAHRCVLAGGTCYHFKLYGMEVRNVLGEWVIVKYTAVYGWKSHSDAGRSFQVHALS